MKQFKTPFFLCFLIVAVSIQASAQKSGKYSLVGGWYHNTVARYNGYYNAKMKMRASLRDAGGSLQDEYENILPLDKGELTSSAAIPDIDSIIMRLAVVAKLHPKSKWVDDSYLLMGKAYYIKKDYEGAQQTFQYISGTFKPKKSDVKKVELSKKRAEYDKIKVPWPEPKGVGGFHWDGNIPVRDEALIWLVKTHIKQKNYDEAQTIINLLEKDNNFQYSLRGELESIHAQTLIDQKKYKEAIRPLMYAIALTKNKKTKTRYAFVLGQLYQLVGNNEKAIVAYKDVLAWKPDYKMQFFANINLAKAYAMAGKGGSDVITMLQKLGRDAKYAEFHDRVYYTIGEIYNKQGNRKSSVENYEKAIRKSVSNKRQQGLAYLRLADMYYNDPVYPIAKKYYDSTIAVIGADYTDYTNLQQRNSVLTNLVTQLNVIAMQDSLQKLAGMTDKERERIVSAALARYEKELQNKLASNNNLGTPNNTANNDYKSAESSESFYFYNTSLKGSGYTEFISRYGNRKNEDNWRRANKKSDIASLDNPEANGPDSQVEASGAVTYESLMAGIPTTPEKMDTSNKKLAAAYYKLGTIYKNDFNNYNKALTTFETLETRLPANTFEPQAWYQMYLIHTSRNETEKATEYRNLILQKYPTNPLALYLQNPNYLKEQEDKSQPAEQHYNYTYGLYQAGQYQAAILAADSSRKLFPTNPFAPKFDLIKAFAIGQTQPKDSFKLALTNFTKHYTEGPEQLRAKELLAMLNQSPVNNFQKQVEKPKEEAAMGDYVFRPTASHFIVIMFDNVEPTNKAIQDSLLVINMKGHSSENLKTNTMLLDEKRQMIIVKQFKSSALAWNYFNELLERENLFDQVETTYRMFVIDDKNFTMLFKNKNIDQYMAFFEKNFK